jgi:hypothetical protein
MTFLPRSPAKAGAQCPIARGWTPAFAGARPRANFLEDMT